MRGLNWGFDMWNGGWHIALEEWGVDMLLHWRNGGVDIALAEWGL